MNAHDSHRPAMRALASDLDGTLIPLEGHPQHWADLETLTDQLHRHSAFLVFVTGRHLASVADAIETCPLPFPDWIICDVGTTICRRQPSGEFEPVAAYQRHQASLIAQLPMDELRDRLHGTPGLRWQEPEKQGPFKLSFYTAADKVEQLAGELRGTLLHWSAPYSVIHSVDPFNGDGLIDVLPRGVSKAHALTWWCEDAGVDPTSIVFAGDSGNDLAAMTSGFRAIVVGNADRQLAQRVSAIHAANGWHDRLHIARASATSGVLEGCRHFGLR